MSDDISFTHYFDLLVQGAAAVGVGVFAWIFRQTDRRLSTLEQSMDDKRIRLALLEASHAELGKSAVRIEGKLDTALEQSRRRS